MENKSNFSGWVGPSYTSRIGRFDCQKTINMFVELDGLGAGKDGQIAMLTSCPGVSLYHTVGTGPIRGLYVPSQRSDLLYIASGNQIFVVSGTTVTTLTGTMNSNVGQIEFADNGSSIMWVDGTNGYYHHIGDPAIVMIVDPNFYPASTITYQDGYFILNQVGTGNFFLSNLYDVSFYPLNTENQSGNADNIVGLVSNNRELYLFGTRTTEIWWNQGASGVSPFSRQDGKFSQYGAVSAASIKSLNNTVFWLGQNDEGQGIVFELNADQPNRISNHAIEFALSSYGDLSQAYAWTYQEEGHFFYVLNVPGAPTTWVYDGSTQQWHERQSNINGVSTRSIRSCHAFFQHNHIVGDGRNGNVYIQSLDVFDENGAPFVRTRQSPHFASNLNQVFYSLLEIDFKFGVGLNAGAGVPANAVNPQAILTISNDGGETWGNELLATLGQLGKTLTRARWTRLGRSRDRVFRVSISDPVKVAMLSAKLDVKQGTG